MGVYVEVDELAEYLRISGMADDVDLTVALETAEQDVDEYCGWGAGGFVKNEAEATYIIKRGSDPYCLRMPYALRAATGVVVKTDDNDDGTFETTWASTDYEFAPVGNVFSGVSGFPFFDIRAVGSRTFPTCTNRLGVIEITSSYWGWEAVPSSVTSAVLQRAAAIHARRVKSVDGTNPLTGFRAGGRDRDWEIQLANLRHPNKFITFA